MSRCKLTTMNLRNIRKSREYQCLLIDFVKMGVVGKTDAESILGYTIPAGLLGTSSESTDPETDPETDSDNTEEGTQRLVTVVYNSAPNTVESLADPLTQFSYNLNDGATDADILAAAHEEFNIKGLNTVEPIALTPTDNGYDVDYLPIPVSGPVSYEAGMILLVSAYEVEEEKPGVEVGDPDTPTPEEE